MGVAGVAALWMLYAVYRSVKAIIVYLLCRKKVRTEGVLTSLKDRTAEYKSVRSEKANSTKYVYEMKISHDGVDYSVDFAEVVDGDKPSRYQSGQVVEVFFDTWSKRAVSVKSVKNELWTWPLMAAAAVLVIAACILIVESM